MNAPLAASYAWCEKIARGRARNFYYSFLLLDRQRRLAMCAIYAFMRICDDLSDEPGERSAEAFDEWRGQMLAALHGRFDANPLWPAFHDAAQRYGIPHEYFHHMIDGVESDIHFQPIQTFDELYQYCYRVASVVGLTVVHILGFRTPEALPLAEKCGVAFQLTNILRDVKEDWGSGRLYLPAEDMARFAVLPAHLDASAVGPELRALLAFEGARAHAYYREALPLLDMVEPQGRPMLSAIIEIYYTLLNRIEREDHEVLRRRISLPAIRKLWIMARTAIHPRPRPSMGPAPRL